ncbi:phage portal protein [Streptomyces sp. PA03-6a]|nr:phage portal protein [Streptomyces sp. PA03-6a]
MGRSLLGSLGQSIATVLNRTPVPYATAGARGSLGVPIAHPAGQEAQMRAMGGVGTLYAIVDRIITSYSQVEWHLYRKAKSGRDEDRVEVTSHAALDLWNSPNEFMTGPQFRESTQQHEELTGEQWWIISKHERFDIPLELWFARPDRMQPVPDPEEFLTGYVYRGPSGERIPLGRDEVIFQRRPNPMDPYRGMGAVQTILIDLDATRASAEWNAAFFRNSAEPGGIVQVDKRLSDEEFEEFRTRWAEQHRGLANAHRVGVLENGLEWVDRKYTMRDMQFAELRDASRETVREAFGFPKPLLGAVDDVNRANADAADAVFARWLVKTRLTRTREALNTRLLPMYGPTAEGLEFDFDNPVPEDAELEGKLLTARASAVRDLVEAGAYGPAVLEAVGLPAIPFGQPDADPDRELLIKLVTRAPTLAPMILPMLGFQLPEGAANSLAAAQRPQARLSLPASSASTDVDIEWGEAVAELLGGDGDDQEVPDVEDAMRWEAVAEIDDNTCKPCADNDGKVYRNRRDAYKDYPGGSGYVHCVGAEYGNDCRCKVIKRRKTKEDDE